MTRSLRLYSQYLLLSHRMLRLLSLFQRLLWREYNCSTISKALLERMLAIPSRKQSAFLRSLFHRNVFMDQI
jgi:hypothetical protein